MLTRIEIGRIAGIPIYLDMLFVLVLLIFTYPYFTAGSTRAMSAGFVIVVGLLLSILLHELGHAFAGRLFGADVKTAGTVTLEGRPVSTLAKVDLPQPDSPTMARVSPGATEKETPSTARTMPSRVKKCVFRPSISSRGASVSIASGSHVAGEARIERVAQTVAQHVHRQHGE